MLREIPYAASVRAVYSCALGLAAYRPTGEVRAITCGQRRCPDCGPIADRNWRRKVSHGFKRSPGRRARLITVTEPARARLLDSSAVREQSRHLRRFNRLCWRDGICIRESDRERLRLYNARRRKRRLKPFPIPPRGTRIGPFDKGLFAGVREYGDDTGHLHLHLVQNGVEQIPQRYLVLIALRAGFGENCDIRAVKAERGISYLMKYATKGREKWWPRYTRTRQTNVREIKPESEWTVVAKWERPRWRRRPEVERMTVVEPRYPSKAERAADDRYFEPQFAALRRGP